MRLGDTGSASRFAPDSVADALGMDAALSSLMRTTMQRISTAAIVTFAVCFIGSGSAEAKKPVPRSEPVAGQKLAAREIDFTDRDMEPRAGLQSSSKEDMDTTAKIRRAIVTDRSLSARARSIGIITDAGQVTLRGDVRSRLEKLAVEKKATIVAGDTAVRSELSVAK